MKVYLAGKISKNDWRHELVAGNQPQAVDSMRDWEQVSSLPMVTGDTYVGPFFIACDHGCSHSGDGAHGAGQGCSGFDFDPTRHRTHVREKAMTGIKTCDLFVADMGLDFESAYGTMAEIGAAHVQGKKIVLIIHPELDTKDFWFLKTMATHLVVSDNPAKAASELLTLHIPVVRQDVFTAPIVEKIEPRDPKLEEATRWLERELCDGRPYSNKELIVAARNAAPSIRRATLERAYAGMPEHVEPFFRARHWYWQLRPKSEQPSQVLGISEVSG